MSDEEREATLVDDFSSISDAGGGYLIEDNLVEDLSDSELAEQIHKVRDSRGRGSYITDLSGHLRYKELLEGH